MYMYCVKCCCTVTIEHCCVVGAQVVEDELIKNHMQTIVEVGGNVSMLLLGPLCLVCACA